MLCCACSGALVLKARNAMDAIAGKLFVLTIPVLLHCSRLADESHRSRQITNNSEAEKVHQLNRLRRKLQDTWADMCTACTTERLHVRATASRSHAQNNPRRSCRHWRVTEKRSLREKLRSVAGASSFIHPRHRELSTRAGESGEPLLG